MKRTIILATILAIFLIGCSDTPYYDKPTESAGVPTEETCVPTEILSMFFDESVIVDGITIGSWPYIKTEWDKIEDEFTVDITELDLWKETKVVDTNQIAVDVGKAIIAELHSRGRYSEHELAGAYLSIEDHVWYYLYIRPFTYGNYLWVGIDGNDGSLLGAYRTN